jgi:hypothetical protein
VLEQFGARTRPVRLSGGQGAAWRSGEVVLKPLDMSEESLQWQLDVLSVLESGSPVPRRPSR